MLLYICNQKQHPIKQKERFKTMAIDKRRTYLLVIDIETARDLDNAIAYDCGIAIADKHGNIYETASYIVEEVFFGCRADMKTAYYAEKLPQYFTEIGNGSRQIVTIEELYEIVNALMKKYNTKAVCAYNARFDHSGLNRTRQMVSNEYFFDYNQPIWDIWKMARQTICKQKLYRKFCEKNGFMYGKNNNICRTNAQTVYAYLTHNPQYEEEHTGLEDVKIETEIMARCFRQHKKMEKELFKREKGE